MRSRSITQTTESKGSLMRKGQTADEKYALISFVSKGKGEQLVKVIRSYQALGNTIMRGRGTARSEILEYLGLELDEKEIVISHIRADQAQAALQALRNKLEMDRPGHGIAFLIPILDSKGLKAIFRLAEQVDQGNPAIVTNVDPASISDEGIIFDQHDLIIAILQTNLAEAVMDCARAAGAPGGTILHGRGGSMHETEALFGIAVEPEKELLLMLVRKNKTETILKAFYKRLGLSPSGKNIAFALPVSAVTGLAHRLIVQEDGSVTEQTYHV